MNDQTNPISPIQEHTADLLAVATMVLWCTCLAIGVVGFLVQPHRTPPTVMPPPIDMELVNAEAINRSRMADENPLPISTPLTEISAPPAQPQITLPSTAAAFAEPVNEQVNGPVHSAARPAVAASQPTAIQLTFGQGEGEQPPPDYPDEARFAGEEGTVVVRLRVGQDGRVSDVIASSPSPWPLLNSAAVRAVRNTWRFRRGAVRIYEVSIQFHLDRHE